MLARLTSPSRSNHPCSPSQFVLFMVAAAATLGGCTEVAGLHEHLPYQGFPDSSSVPCSNGFLFTNCANVQDKPQDGHFLTAKPNYERSGIEILDTVTGLSWYRTAGPPKDYESAKNYCDVLDGDYRLPTRIELASLLDFREKSAIRIDTEIFENVQPAVYSTSSPYGTDANQYWAVDFCANCPSSLLMRGYHVTNPAGSLCVKSAGDPFETGPFEVAGVKDRFLRDTRTGLMWMKQPLEEGTKWDAAGKACQDAPDGSYGDFRLPNAKEIATIVNDHQTDSALLTFSPFDFRDEFLWSSTPSRELGKFFMLHTGGGSVGPGSGGEGYIRAVCVRGPD